MVLAANNRFVRDLFFPAHLPQCQNTFAANAMVLAAMDDARLGLQPNADVRGIVDCVVFPPAQVIAERRLLLVP